MWNANFIWEKKITDFDEKIEEQLRFLDDSEYDFDVSNHNNDSDYDIFDSEHNVETIQNMESKHSDYQKQEKEERTTLLAQVYTKEISQFYKNEIITVILFILIINKERIWRNDES